MAEKLPWRTGTETCTILEAHPDHKAVAPIDHTGAGEYEMAYDPQCPLCRMERDDATTTEDQGARKGA